MGEVIGAWPQGSLPSVAEKARVEAKYIADYMRQAIAGLREDAYDSVRDEWLTNVADTSARFVDACDTFEEAAEVRIREFLERLQYFISNTSDMQKLLYFVDQLANRYADRIQPAFDDFAAAQAAFENELEQSAQKYQNSMLSDLPVQRLGVGYLSLFEIPLATKWLLSVFTNSEYWTAMTGGMGGTSAPTPGEVAGGVTLTLAILGWSVSIARKSRQTTSIDPAQLIQDLKDPGGFGIHEDY